MNEQSTSNISVKKVSLSVFMPFFNEEKNISLAIAKAHEALLGSPYISTFEVIMVNDGSTDSTQKIALSLIPRYKNLKLISHEKNKGYGAAIITGIQNCTLDYVFFTDGDLQFDIADINKLLQESASFDVVIGYREDRKDPFSRIVNAYAWNQLNHLFFGLKVKDINCAFKLFKRSVIADLPLVSHGAMISSEILIRLGKKGTAFKEVPVAHLPRIYGISTGARVGVIFRAGLEFIRLYQNL